MKTNSSHKNRRFAFLLGLSSLLSLTAPIMHATPLVTLRVQAVQTGLTASTSPGVDILAGGLSVEMGVPAGQVVLQLVAILHGLDADLSNESFTRTDGSWVSFGTTGGLTGSLRTDNSTGPGINNVNPFREFSADSGAPGELSGTVSGGVADGILDIGGIAPFNQTGYFTATANIPVGIVGQSHILGETVLSLDAGEGTTAVRFFPHIGIGGVAFNRINLRFSVDNVAYLFNGDGTHLNGGTADPDALQYEAVTIVKNAAVPEPSAFTLLLPAALGLGLHRRRR